MTPMPSLNANAQSINSNLVIVFTPDNQLIVDT